MRAAITAALLAAGLSGCVLNPVDPTPGELRRTSRMTLSDDGRRLLVQWTDGTGLRPAHHARLLDLDGTRVTAARDVVLPEATTGVSFRPEGRAVVVTTDVREGVARLLAVDLAEGTQRELHRATSRLDDPDVQPDGAVLFAEHLPGSHRMKIALRLLPDGEMVTLPEAPRWQAPETPGPRACAKPERWQDPWAPAWSRDGRTLVFHAARGAKAGARGLYVVRPMSARCVTMEIPWPARAGDTIRPADPPRATTGA